ncbi:hypothetical protein [Winogradskyella sp. PC-19]|uniref:hypothetical protein n=1 Tax=Winogradskyella sp. PC-19 TaxID=754417 RepID=UPI0012FB7480|nr:hypothetical protein [Winogradskyella sp. PC-19]
MHRELLIKAFQKAEEEIQTDKVLPRAKLLSDFILEDSKEPYGEKILGIKFKAVKDGAKKTIRLKKHAEEALSHYLDYEDYPSFLKANSVDKPDDKGRVEIFWNKNKIILIVSLVIITSIIIYNSLNRQRWMIWQEDHYIEVKLDLEKYNVNQLKVYKEERVEFFKKINPDCSYKFFNDDGSVIIWYGKNIKKELEYFTALGLHPETGVTLKPITNYMINKHICDN